MRHKKHKTKSPILTKHTLATVVAQSEQARILIEESAEELSSVNDVLMQKLVEQVPPVETVLERSLAVESKVQEASEKLTVVNRALADEMREREMLEYRLAAATEQEVAARHAALHDPLTGLPNRALFEDRLENALAQAKRHPLNLAVMFLDLDQFKTINDSYGHDVGDSVLRTIAARLVASIRSNDTISRFGGDEFLYLLMDANDSLDIELVATKLIEAIEAPCLVSAANGEFDLCIRASIGVALFPEHGDNAEALLKSADSAMYQAKKSGSGFALAA